MMNAEDLYYLEVWDADEDQMTIHSAHPDFGTLLRFAHAERFRVWKIYEYKTGEFICIAQGWRPPTLDEDIVAADYYTNFGQDDPAESTAGDQPLTPPSPAGDNNHED